MRHVIDLLLGVVDGLDDGSCEFLQLVRKAVFFGCGFTVGGACFGVGGNSTVGIKTADGAVAFLEDSGSFFDQGLDVVDELLFVEFVAGGAVGFLDVLE